jgi:hypothetical protein
MQIKIMVPFLRRCEYIILQLCIGWTFKKLTFLSTKEEEEAAQNN